MINLYEELYKYFGHSNFRDGQEEIISAIIKGEQVIAVLPTGAGKSLCYQLPGLISDNFSIVISPLIALMKDQVDNLNKNRELAAFINSTMSFAEIENVLQKISYGSIKLLYVAPERLDNKSFAERISKLNPNFLFIDEAHCISEWGHNFRPSYTKIGEFVKYCSIKKVSAFTATATLEVVTDIGNQLKFTEPKLFVKGFERTNLYLNVHRDVKKNNKALELLSVTNAPTIIYTSSRNNAEDLVEYLTLKGISCGYYHAGLDPISRRRVQEDFINNRLRVICATNAFGMGIDKKDIRLIIHYNIPGSIENYYQEIGRAGRDEKDSYIHLFYDEKDINIQNFFISSSHPTRELIQDIYSAICDFNRIAVGSLSERELIIDEKYITNYTGSLVSQGLLHSAIRFLESAGYMRMISELEKKDTVQILMSKNRIEEFVRRTSSAELKNCLLILLREFGSELFSNHKKISIRKLSGLVETSKEALHNSMITLDNLGIISYRPSLNEESVLLTAPRIEKENLQLNHKRINESYLNAQKKLDKMVEYVFTNDCRFKHIVSYFGEDVTDYKCGKCDSCVTSNNISDSTVEYLSEIILSTLAETDKPLPENSLIKIIQGIQEKPSFSSFKDFGSASNYGKNELKIIVQNLISRRLISVSAGNTRYLELTSSGFDKIGRFLKEIKINTDYTKDLELYHHLRGIRKIASERFIQTPYLLCPDNVLSNVAKEKPKTRSELLKVEGFNIRMFNKIGNDFLDAIKKYSSNKKPPKDRAGIPQNIKGTYDLLIKKYSLKEIAELRKLTEPVISMQIESILEYFPDCDISNLFEDALIEVINKEIIKGYSSLKELKEKLPGRISYAQIRIVAAKNKTSLPS